jgi:polysaccharide export outer membrane protein
MISLRVIALTAISGVLVFCGFAQPALAPTPVGTPSPSGYVLGPNDQISVQVLELPEIQAKSYRIDSDGRVNLPVAGRVRAGGLTLDQFEAELTAALHAQVLNPHVSATLVESKSQPVSVLGAVNAPGTQQIEGAKTLFDVIAAAGGLKQDAGNVITITRQKDEGPLDLPNTKVDPVTGRSTAEVAVQELVDGHTPAANIRVTPHDEVTVSTGRVMYVIGNVKKPGGFTLSGKRRVSALEAVSLAEGFSPNASPKSARILRRTSDGELARRPIPINLKKILAGKAEDVQIFPDDILFIPNSNARVIINRTAEAALGTISGVIIWRGI